MKTRAPLVPILVVLALLTATTMLAGCGKATTTGEQAGEAIISADDPAAQATCFTNQLAARTEVVTFYMNNPDARPPMQVSVLIQQGALTKAPVCPSGGKIESFNPNDLGFICSIHGEAQEY